MMLRPALLLLVTLSCKFSFAQCDSAEVREWIRTMKYDTVCRGYYRYKTHKQSFIHFNSDSSFTYSYHDSVTHEYQHRLYKDFRLIMQSHTKGNMYFSDKYYEGTCRLHYHEEEIWNDSLSTEDEGGTVYDYYRSITYDEEGNKLYMETQTFFIRHGKRYARKEYIDYTKLIDRRKVYIYEQTKGNR